MEQIDKRMVLELIEDALADTNSPHGCGLAAGLCGAFYMSGLLSEDEWETFLKRIPAEPYMFEGRRPEVCGQLLH